MKRKILLLQGVSGAGKSTYAADLLAKETAQEGCGVTVSADDYRYDEQGNYVITPHTIQEGHRLAFRKYAEYVVGGFPFSLLVVDNTNTTPEATAPYTLLADAFGIPWEIHYLRTHALDRCVERNTHNIEKDIITRMYNALEAWPSRIPRIIIEKDIT